MTAAEIFALASRGDIVLEVHGDRLVADAPTGALTPGLRAELVRHKPALMAMLAPAFVTLTHGPTVPIVALALAVDLEDRGFRLLLDDAGEAVLSRQRGSLMPTGRRLVAGGGIWPQSRRTPLMLRSEAP